MCVKTKYRGKMNCHHVRWKKMTMKIVENSADSFAGNYAVAAADNSVDNDAAAAAVAVAEKQQAVKMQRKNFPGLERHMEHSC